MRDLRGACDPGGTLEYDPLRWTVAGGDRPRRAAFEVCGGGVCDRLSDESPEYSKFGCRGSEEVNSCVYNYTTRKKEACSRFETGVRPPFLSSSSSERKEEPSDPREISGSVLPVPVTVESLAGEGDRIKAVRDVMVVGCWKRRDYSMHRFR